MAWSLLPGKLERTETLLADKDLKIRRWRAAVPTTADRLLISMNIDTRTDVFLGREGTLKVTANADWKFATSLEATGDSKRGKGVLGAIPLHLIYSAEDLKLERGKSLTWRLTLEVSKQSAPR